MNTPIRHIGRLEHRIVDVASEYERLAQEDEAAGTVLREQGCFRQATYFYVQAMEKYIRHRIFSLVNANIDYYRKRTITHNIDDLIDFLIEIVASDSIVKEQVKNQMYEYVLGGVRFGKLHNDLRYPSYSDRYKNYSILIIEESDALFTEEKLSNVKLFLRDIYMIVN